MRFVKTGIALSVMLALQGCSIVQVEPAVATKAKETPRVENVPTKPRSYVRISSPKHQLLSQKTRVNRQNISIGDALMAPKGLGSVQLIAKDTGVDLTRKVSLRVSDMTIKDYLKHLGNLSNYDYQLDVSGDTPVIEISSMIMREWNLAAISNMPDAVINSGLSATISSGTEDENGGTEAQGSGANIKISRKDDTWATTVAHARDIIGIEDDDEDEDRMNATIDPFGGAVGDSVSVPDMSASLGALDGSFPSAPSIGNGSFSSGDYSKGPYGMRKNGGAWLVENRRLGTVTAFAKPNDIKRLDSWLGELEKEVTRQVFLDVAILDVTTAKGDGYGVDWSAVYERGSGSTKTLSSSNSESSPMSVVDGGLFSLTGTAQVGNVTLSTLINALSEEGSVKLQSQPKMTVTNGYTAYLGATEEVSYVSDVEILPVDSTDGGVGEPIVSTNLSRVSVGLKLAVTPRLLPDGDILVEVVPVLSSIKGYTEIESSSQNILTPNIALQELATQVITKSGKPIHLGGLILSRIIENAKRMPLAGGGAGKRLGELLGSMKVEEEGKELLIVITPTEVGT
jgi:type II secretory pathway component GspD/PulD (secretin)